MEAIAKVSNESSMDSPKFRALVSSLVFDISRINSTFDKSTEELNTNSILMEICGALDSCSSQKILQSIAKIDSEIEKANKSGVSVPTELNDLIGMIGNIRPAVARSFTSGLQLSEADINEISKIKDFIVELAKKETPELTVPLSNSAHNDSTVAIEAEEKRLTLLISHHNEDDGSEDVKESIGTHRSFV